MNYNLEDIIIILRYLASPMVEQAQTRKGLAVPVSCHQCESTVLPIPIDKAWGFMKNFQVAKALATRIKEAKFTSGGPGQLDSIIKIDYQDGAHWEIRVIELSDIKYSFGYQVISTEPAHQVTSIQGQITLKPITDENTTFVQWVTDFSNDADVNVIEDQKYKKLEFFSEMKKYMTTHAATKQ